MENNLRQYQQDIIKMIIKWIKKGKKEIIIQMSTGTGKSLIIQKLLEQLASFKTHMITANRLVEQQWKEKMQAKENIKVNAYNDEFSKDTAKKYVIVENAQELPNIKYKNIKEMFPNAIFIFFCDRIPSKKTENTWLKDKEIDYSYTLQEIIQDGYINPKYITRRNFEQLIFHLLILSDYTIDIEPKIEWEKQIYRPDFIISKEKKKKIIEVKEYRSKFISNTVLNGAVEQVNMYRRAWKNRNKENIQAILIVSCQVSNEVKEKYYKESNVLIIDISNLLYLLQDNDEMMKRLTESVQYNIFSIPPQKILDTSTLTIKEKKKKLETKSQNAEAITLIEKLENMPYGKEDNSDKIYEKLCTDIINYLFKSDFTRMKEQHTTEDQMFRMDLICGIKDTSEFWNILIKHYNTRFVVFEFKNYEEKINQNLIYITEKYLYHATLRNVAIIISRKGFSSNAHKAANGILTENGKLIIDLCDEDIISMLRMKADEEDASDYMLDKLEKWLISISK